MNALRFVFVGAVVCSISGCQTLPQLTLYEVDAERQRLHAEGLEELEKGLNTKDNKKYWIQPKNKKVKCLLPTSKAFLEEDGHFVVWDGRCRNGYAQGFGRGIYISDRIHAEEITYHDRQKEDRIYVFINYVNNTYNRAQVTVKGGAIKTVGQLVSKNTTNGNVNYSFASLSEKEGCAYGSVFDGVTPQTKFFVRYPKYTLNFYKSDSDYYQWRQQFFTTANDDERVFGPILSRAYNGNSFTEFNRQLVVIPVEYWQNFDIEIPNINEEVVKIETVVNSADQLLRQYKEKVCPNPNQKIPKGISKERYFQICEFEKHFFAELPQLRIGFQNQVNNHRNLLNQERMIRAQQAQAQAAAAQAAAAQAQAREARETNQMVQDLIYW